MKIVRADVYLATVGGRHPVLVELTTDDGLVGVGEAALAYGVGGTAAAGMIKDLCERFLPGMDPFAIQAWLSQVYDHGFWAKGGGPVIFSGISAIEEALWDIKAKALGVPVYQLLGGACRRQIRVYANGWSLDASAPADFARRAEQTVKDGYTALKLYPLSIPVPNSRLNLFDVPSFRLVDRDLEDLAVARVRAVRQAVGPKIDLMVDLNALVTADGAIRLGRRLAEYDLLFYEEPLEPTDIAGLARVAQSTSLPIATGERLYTRYGFKALLESRAVDIVQPDVGNAGGIWETVKIAAMAEAYGLRVAPHNCASPVSTAVALQVDACLPNFLIQEIFPFLVPEHYQVMADAPELRVQNGYIAVPSEPGAGIVLCHDVLRPFLWYSWLG